MLRKTLMLTAFAAAFTFAAAPAFADNGKTETHKAETAHVDSHPDSHPDTHPAASGGSTAPAHVDSSPDKSGTPESHSSHVDLVPDSSLIN